jgi:hypothetical protein
MECFWKVNQTTVFFRVTSVNSASMDGPFAWKRLYDPPRSLFREFCVRRRLSPGVNIPEHVTDHCPVYYEIKYMELFLRYPTSEWYATWGCKIFYCSPEKKLFPSNSGAKTSQGYCDVV